MKRRQFLGVIGAAAVAPALPAVPEIGEFHGPFSWMEFLDGLAGSNGFSCQVNRITNTITFNVLAVKLGEHSTLLEVQRARDLFGV